MKPIQAMIVDDSLRLRSGLRALLATCPQVEVICEAADGNEALLRMKQQTLDAVLLDVRMPGMDGLAAARHIKQQWPQVRVVMLSMYAEYQCQALAAGAEAFLVKGCSLDCILEALAPPPGDGGQAP